MNSLDPRPLVGVFVDDNPDESHFVADLTSDQLKIEFLRADGPLDQFVRELLGRAPSIVVVDYRLDDYAAAGAPANAYRAGALAQYLRDFSIDNLAADIPVVLFSAEPKLRQVIVPGTGLMSLFDYWDSKDSNDKTQLRARLAALASGFVSLKAARESGKSLDAMLGLAQGEAYIVEHQELVALGGLPSTHAFWKQFYKLLLERNGLLLDHWALRARLGIHPDSQALEPLFGELSKNSIEYRGPFALGWVRWWAHRFENWSRAVLDSHFEDLTASERCRLVKEKLGIQLKPAVSRWLGTSDSVVKVSCASCDHPTEIPYTVFVADSDGLRWLEPRRICWSCVQSGEYERRSLKIDDASSMLERQLTSGRIRRPEAS